VIQRAAIHVQFVGPDRGDGFAMCGRHSLPKRGKANAAYFLQEQDMTAFDA